jgi:catechol 2,3-dioxygenase-like lactoylglutathione lyase family enzyme
MLEMSFRREAIMKRFHVHVAVKDIQASTRFYSAIFGIEPTVLKPDYAKWLLEDPRVNFAISQRSHALGVNHLGFQAETEEELEGIHANLRQADRMIVAEREVSCCYAKSDKYWITDPQGVAWESFRSLGTVPIYGADSRTVAGACGTRGACCVPNAEEPEAAATGCCSSA